MSVEQVRKTAWKYVLDQPMRILVVDDDPILREFASVYLSTPTATVETAPDGLAALDLLKAEAFDVAVIDIDMPGNAQIAIGSEVGVHLPEPAGVLVAAS